MSSTARPYQTAHAQMENSRSRTCASEQSKDAIENALRELRQMGQALEEDFEAANGPFVPSIVSAHPTRFGDLPGRVRVENRSSVPVELTSCATGRIATSNALNMNVMVQAVGVGVGHETKYGVGQVFETKHTLVGTKPGVEPAHTHLSLVGWSHIHVTIRALDPHRPCLISSTDLASMNTFFLEEKDFAPDPAGGVTSATDPHIKSNADSGNLSKKEKRLRCIFWPCFMCCGD